jgi:uncharacterized coiled-coil protein SlyX
MRPTEAAKVNFDMAIMFSQGQAKTIMDINMVLNQLAQGLSSMNTGLRATYMKLEEIERQLKRP